MSASVAGRWSFLALVLLVACKPEGPRLTITADPVSVEIGECAFTTIRVSGTMNGAPLLEGSTPISFETDYGSFEKSVDCGDASLNVQEKNDGAVAGHAVAMKLYGNDLPPQGGRAHVTATATDSYGNQATVRIDIEFKPAGNASQLDFTCSTYNIGALASTSTSIEVPCHVSVTDDADETVVGAQINFLTEAGRMGNTDGQLVYLPRGAGSKHLEPKDVDPFEGEPNRTTPDGKVHNPRDGLVTVTAWVLASKEATDRELLSEPYVDVNDSGSYDPGEPYMNLNDNGQWDELQDDDPAKPHALWKKIKILWSGSLQSDSAIAQVDPNFAEVLYGGSTNFTFSLLDQNYNVLAANDASDSLTWIVSQEPDVTVVSSNPISLFDPSDERHLGMLLDDNFEFVDPSNPLNWGLGGSVGVTVQNTMACHVPLVAERFNLHGEVSRTLALTPQGDPSLRVNESTMTVSGSLQPPPPSVCAH